MPPEADCLCGSGRPYGACCRLQRYWHPICPDPDLRGYSLLAPQTAIFAAVDGDTIRDALIDDPRLHCVEDTGHRSFWLHWGNPARESRYGIICFGDFELRDRRTLIITAMSNRRRRILLDLVRGLAAAPRKAPRIEYKEVPVTDKRTGQTRLIARRRKRK